MCQYLHILTPHTVCQVESFQDVSALHTQNTAASFFRVPSLKLLHNTAEKRTNCSSERRAHHLPVAHRRGNKRGTFYFTSQPKHGHAWNDTWDMTVEVHRLAAWARKWNDEPSVSWKSLFLFKNPHKGWTANYWGFTIFRIWNLNPGVFLWKRLISWYNYLLTLTKKSHSWETCDTSPLQVATRRRKEGQQTSNSFCKHRLGNNMWHIHH